jgi:hypothetical protein
VRNFYINPIFLLKEASPYFQSKDSELFNISLETKTSKLELKDLSIVVCDNFEIYAILNKHYTPKIIMIPEWNSFGIVQKK